VPLDLRVLRALRSPFEIDIYVWLTWRFFRLRKPVVVPWKTLQLQFGCDYGVVARFNGSANWAFLPTRPSRHDGVGVRSAELGHPIEDVTPDHGLFRLRCASPRPQAATEH